MMLSPIQGRASRAMPRQPPITQPAAAISPETPVEAPPITMGSPEWRRIWATAPITEQAKNRIRKPADPFTPVPKAMPTERPALIRMATFMAMCRKPKWMKTCKR